MGKLKVLPAQLANMIAAGEVVQRPSSVVKELMENAVDAGAGDVKVIVSDSGRTLIQVIDNGAGMSPSDAVLCFERHATSKIATTEDLDAIMSYGFRGEALASIAAVAEVTLKTRRPQDELGTQVSLGGNAPVKTASVSAPAGSNFEVRNLFFNTPARRKFLKSDAVELRHITDEFIRVALTRPETAFSLTSNGRPIFVLGAAKSLKFRILDLLGSGVASDVVDLEQQTSLVGIRGYLGRPESARKALGNQYFFVNGRFFRSPYLHKAVMRAYEEYIPEGLTPSYFIWLECDPHSVDVNISPTKSEVKFAEDSAIYQTLYACVKATLGQNAFGGGIDFEAGTAAQLPNLSRSYEEYHGPVHAPVPELDPGYDPFTSPAGGGVNLGFDNHSGETPIPGPGASAQEPRPLIPCGKFILMGAASGALMAVNVRRARERVLYERSLAALGSNGAVSQRALFPVPVQVGPQARMLFEENARRLAALGFDIASFGTDTVVVNAVPQGCSCEPGKVQQMTSDMVLILSEDPSALPERMNSTLAARFATLGSMNSEPVRSIPEARALLEALFGCDNPDTTPGGRRITAIVAPEEIEKKF